MKAIHGGKAKNDRIDAYKIAYLLRGGNIPMAYVYPPEMRATRDLISRRNHLMRKRAERVTCCPCPSCCFLNIAVNIAFFIFILLLKSQ
jgi:hypothetical protein